MNDLCFPRWRRSEAGCQLVTVPVRARAHTGRAAIVSGRSRSCNNALVVVDGIPHPAVALAGLAEGVCGTGVPAPAAIGGIAADIDTAGARCLRARSARLGRGSRGGFLAGN